MKIKTSNSKTVYCAFVLIFIATFFSCKNNEQKGEQNKNLKLAIFGSYSGTCNQPSKVKMVVEDGSCDLTSITITSTSDTSIHGFYVYVLDSIQRDKKNHTVTVPNDGKNYWYVPSTTDGIAKILEPGAIVFSCLCNDSPACNGCDTRDDDRVGCMAKGCQCCQLTSYSSGKTPQNFTGGGIILQSQNLIYNGNKYYNYTSYIGNHRNPGKSSMQIAMIDSITYITIDTFSQSIITDGFNTRLIGLSFKGDSVTIPNDGKKYWLVPFDNKEDPKILTTGTGTLDCECSDPIGGCVPSTSTDASGNKTIICCSGGCSQGCDPIQAVSGITHVGPAVLLRGNLIYINGVKIK